MPPLLSNSIANCSKHLAKRRNAALTRLSIILLVMTKSTTQRDLWAIILRARTTRHALGGDRC